MTGPACGNNPNHKLTDGDRQAVADFKAYLAARAALRDRIAAALYERERPPREPVWADARPADREVFEAMADAVLPAVLPAPVDRIAVLREAAAAITDVIERDRAYSPRRSNDRAALGAAREIVLGLIDNPRRVADETAATDTQPEAWCPPGCIACATDESHDPAPAAGARQDGAQP
ncbi:hypothetical protein AB0E06_10505 [Streptomyces sp. NPDC048109]|uniref:hypothetical protein n=1 Tax=Streptomyces sp. NPDC048109 TaxID=3155482 RepID=UPI00343D6626